MPAASDPSAWQIFPDAGGHFLWAVAGANAESRCEDSCVALALRRQGQPRSQLPSMADLFLKVSSELREGGDEGCVSGAPMFRTASGRSVSVRQSSIRKAESVLGETGIPDRGTPMVQNSGVCDGGFPKFCTGSGKAVIARQSSIRKAAVALEGAPVVQNSDVCDVGFPMFRTGLGKSVTVRQSSIRKAATVLEGENLDMAEILKPSECVCNRNTAPIFQNGTGKSIPLKQSSIKKAMSVLKNVANFEADLGLENRINDGCSFSNSLFQSGSGKTVSISSAGLLRAATLLGVEENHASSYGFASEMIGFNSGDPKSENVDPEVLVNANLRANVNRNVDHKGGRYISVSTDALQRAKSLLGDANFGVLRNDMEASKPLNTFLKDDKPFDDISWNKESLNFSSIFTNAEICKTNKSMCPGAQPFSSRKSGAVAFDRVNARGHVAEMLETKSIDGLPLRKLESISIRRSSTLDDAFGIIRASTTNGEPLVDISNTTGTEHTTRNCRTSERKRLGRRSSISSFKRPRNSRFDKLIYYVNSSSYIYVVMPTSLNPDGSTSVSLLL
ncbi:putative breast cancer type 2 susceptibility protein [Dioscorea sansibarensis]